MSEIVRHLSYEVRKDAVPAALAAAAAFVDEVRRKEGGTARYAAFQQKDQPTRFVHTMAFRTPSAEEYHRKTQWHKRFLETLGPLCVSPPASVDLVAL